MPAVRRRLPQLPTSLHCQRLAQAASCFANTPRQPRRRATSSVSRTRLRGSRPRVSLRATATERSKHTTCPGREVQLQDHLNWPSSVGGRSRPSICSDAAAAMASPLSERLVRHTARSCSCRSDTSPRFKPSNDASSVTSTSPSSISNWINCAPIARSLNDTRRKVRRRTPSGSRPQMAAFGEETRRASCRASCDATTDHRVAAPEVRQAAVCGPSASRRLG